MTRDGFIFVHAENEPDDIYVKAAKTSCALNGDIVRVAITREKTQNQRCEGQVIRIVERSVKPFVGILHIIGDQAWVLMQSKIMPYDITIPMDADAPGHLKMDGPESYSLHKIVDEAGTELQVRQGMKVAAVVDKWNRNDPCPTGHLVDVLGEPGENDTEMHAILAEFNLPYRFEPEVAAAADSISEEITEKDLKGRRDFRDTLTFTIDPSDAKDFDDALSLRKLENGNYEVGVHIADVTYYVKTGTIVDEEAKARGTSVYLVDRTVPMLPEKLCNKLCSLRPNEEKLTFSAVFEMDPKGKVVDRWIGRTVIDSNWRFDYEQAQSIIMEQEGERPMPEVPGDIREALHILHSLATILRKKRFAAGAISFDRPEMKVIVDEKGRPIDVRQKESVEANWLIEEFMLLANRCVAEYVSAQKKTFVYRIHDLPNQEKIENLRSFVRNFGYKLGPASNGKEASKALNDLFKEVKDTPEFNAIELLALRTMAKAVYSTDNIGHYGLAFNDYTHFTSPIRRYPDMMVHRLLSRYLDGADSANKDAYEALCKHCSDRETVATDAERASVKYKLVEFMQDKVGYEFDGHISGLTDWGMYVEIEPTKIEGMVALRDIRSDFFDFDEENYLLRGRHTGIVYRMGDAVKVRVSRASLDQLLLDYELIETGNETREAAPVQARGPVEKPAKKSPAKKGTAKKSGSASKSSKAPSKGRTSKKK